MFDDLKEMIKEFVEVDDDKITMEARLIEDLGFNSYDLMCLVGEIEERYEVEVDEKDVINLHTVGEVVEYMQSQLD
jgi:acyl carrier protein